MYTLATTQKRAKHGRVAALVSSIHFEERGNRDIFNYFKKYVIR